MSDRTGPSIHATDPIIHIIDSDEQNIGSFPSRLFRVQRRALEEIAVDTQPCTSK
jgi:hypothetical protein